MSYPHFGPKNTRSNFSSISDTYFNSLCFTPQFSTVLQLHIFTTAVFNFLAYKAIQSAFLALQVIWRFLNQLHVFLHFIPSFLHKNHTKGILVMSCSGTHFSPYVCLWVFSTCLCQSLIKIMSKNHFSIASESVWVVLVLRGILVFSHQNFDREVF